MELGLNDQHPNQCRTWRQSSNQFASVTDMVIIYRSNNEIGINTKSLIYNNKNASALSKGNRISKTSLILSDRNNKKATPREGCG
jgi:hypothetical protein